MESQQVPLLDNTQTETQKLLELQSTFVQNVEHELRTPVTIIQGYAELLSEGSLGTLAPEQQQAIFAITDRAHKLRMMIERIGTLLALQGQLTPTMPLNLAYIVAEKVDMWRAQAGEAGINLDVCLDPDTPQIAGQPFHLKQAVECLVENAFKFTPPGGQVRVRVGVEQDEWVYLSVIDNGIGIPQEELGPIFESFYQVDSSLTRHYNGLGLGLSVTKGVVEAYHGQVDVVSQIGQGSRFTVKFPVLGTEDKVTKTNQEQVKAERILIVDDEEFVAMTLEQGLEMLPNCQVFTTTSGTEALKLFAEQPFDLLITDYKMPDMDGLTLAEQVRRLYPQTVIIMITAYSNSELHQRASDVSIQRILNKPVALGEVRRIASEVLQETNETD